MKVRRLLGLVGVITALAVILAGCESSSTSAMSGKLQINITDAPADLNIEQVWLTVEGVKIHLADNATVSPTTPITETTTVTETTTAEVTETETESSSGWLSLDLEGPTRFNLLEYQGGSVKKLAFGYLEEGTYTQIRLDVSLVEIKLANDPVLKTVKLPSSTLKFIHPFEIAKGQVTEILFDFDALKSINETSKGNYICKPVIKLTTTQEAASGNIIISPLSLPDGTVGTPYTSTLFTATGGTPSYTWSVSGNVPDGMTFNTSTATLSGTPTVAGAFTFSIIVKDSTMPVKNSATKEFTVNIIAQPTQTTTVAP